MGQLEDFVKDELLFSGETDPSVSCGESIIDKDNIRFGIPVMKGDEHGNPEFPS